MKVEVLGGAGLEPCREVLRRIPASAAEVRTLVAEEAPQALERVLYVRLAQA